MNIVLFCSLCILVSAKNIKHLEEEYETCCPETFVVDPDTLHCVCPSAQSFITADNKCVACSPPYFWDPLTRQCETCPPNAWWEQQKQGCVGCPAGFIVADKQCICPETSPYLTVNNTCVSCPKQSWWDYDQRTCYQCPNGLFHNAQLDVCECPTSSPYLNSDSKCVSCPTGAVWNPSLKICQTCPANSRWNSELLACMGCQSGYWWDPSSSTCISCPSGFQFDPATLKCSCPTDRPLLSSDNKCTACEEPLIWIHSQKQCASGCAYGLKYDTNSKQCV